MNDSPIEKCYCSEKLGYTCQYCAPQHTSPEKEVSQEQPPVDPDMQKQQYTENPYLKEPRWDGVPQPHWYIETLPRQEPTYIDQVIEEFMETFLREKLEGAMLEGVRLVKLGQMTFRPVEGTKYADPNYHYEAGKTATKERQRIREIVEGIIDQNDDGMWSGREILDDLLSRLDEGESTP